MSPFEKQSARPSIVSDYNKMFFFKYLSSKNHIVSKHWKGRKLMVSYLLHFRAQSRSFRGVFAAVETPFTVKCTSFGKAATLQEYHGKRTTSTSIHIVVIIIVII